MALYPRKQKLFIIAAVRNSNPTAVVFIYTFGIERIYVCTFQIWFTVKCIHCIEKSEDIQAYIIKSCTEVEINVLTFTVKASNGGEWPAACLNRFTTAETPRHSLDVRMDETKSLYTCARRRKRSLHD
jgi:hypothetical protein